MYNKSERKEIFSLDSIDVMCERIQLAVWLTLGFYSFFYYYLDAKVASNTVAAGFVFLSPLTYFLYKKSNQNFSKILFIISCNFYIYFTGLIFKHQVHVEYFYIPVMIIPLLILKPDQKKLISFGVMTPLLSWFLSIYFGHSFIPSSWSVENPPIILINRANFFLSFTISLYFLTIFIRSTSKLNLLMEKHMDLSKLSHDIQKISKTGGWELNIETEEVLWTDEVYHIHGIPLGTSTDKIQAISFYAPHERERILKCVENCITKKEKYDEEFEFIDNGGTKKWVRAVGEPIIDESGKVIKLVGLFQDITKEKKALEDQRFILSNMKIGLWKWDIKNNHLIWDQSMYNLYGINAESFSGGYDAWEKTIHPDFKEQANQDIQDALNGIRDFDTIFAIITGDQSTKFIKARGKIDRNDDGDPVMMYGLNWDYTESYHVEQELNRQSAFLRSTVDKMPASFYVKDLEGCYIMVNKTLEDIFQSNEKNIIGKTDYDFFSREKSDLLRRDDLRVIQEDKIIEVEENFTDRNNKERIFHTFKYPYKDEKGKSYAVGGISLDITEMKEFEKKLYHSSKLASIGELAAGVGHEINNPLTIISGFIQILKKESIEKFDNKKFHETLERMLQATNRIAHIVNGLRTFARTDDEKFEQIDLFEIINESIEMVREIFDKSGVHISYKNEFSKDKLLIQGNRGKIQQVLMNLITNARDATEGQEKRIVKVKTTVNDHQVILSVEDNGTGIPKDVKERIFDPFYTTKDVGKGTGIGLSIVHTIIEEHKATIDLKTQEEKGTSFILNFKIDQSKPQPLIPQLNSSSMSDFNIKDLSLNAIVADDEESIREFIEDILTELGIHVETFPNGEKAFSEFKKRPDHYDLIVSDMKMPIMDGIELLNKIRSTSLKKQPHFFFMTGGVNVDFESKSNKISQMIDGHFYKPFDHESIAQKITAAFQDYRHKKSA